MAFVSKKEEEAIVQLSCRPQFKHVPNTSSASLEIALKILNVVWIIITFCQGFGYADYGKHMDWNQLPSPQKVRVMVGYLFIILDVTLWCYYQLYAHFQYIRTWTLNFYVFLSVLSELCCSRRRGTDPYSKEERNFKNKFTRVVIMSMIINVIVFLGIETENKSWFGWVMIGYGIFCVISSLLDLYQLGIEFNLCRLYRTMRESELVGWEK